MQMKQKNGANYIQAIQKVNLDEEKETIQNDKEGLDDAFRLLAIVNYDAGHVDSDIVRSNNNEMSIQSLISGIVMLFAPVEEVAVAEKVYKGLLMTDKIIEKTIQDTWDESAHEEGYQIAKDLILEMGGLK